MSHVDIPAHDVRANDMIFARDTKGSPGSWNRVVGTRTIGDRVRIALSDGEFVEVAREDLLSVRRLRLIAGGAK